MRDGILVWMALIRLLALSLIKNVPEGLTVMPLMEANTESVANRNVRSEWSVREMVGRCVDFLVHSADA